jgi:hypothetical protein
MSRNATGASLPFCSAVVRDKIWFLSMFWTLPEFQRRGLGRPLLERVHQEGVRRGAQVFCTWSSIDYAAIATYLRLGMMPGGPIFTFAGPVLNEPDQEAAVCMRALESTSACAIDRVVRGTTRAADHAYWLQARGASGFQLDKGGRVSGYFYVNAGVIGPAAWLTREDGAPLLACALREAKKQAPEAGLMAIGTNEDAIQVALRAGLRIAGTSHWLRSTSFGMLDRYLPSGPALF